MQRLFQFFYGIHPLLPLAYLLLLAIGLLTPVLYCVVRKIPYSIVLIWGHSKAADPWARTVVALYSLLVAVTVCALFAVWMGR